MPLTPFVVRHGDHRVTGESRAGESWLAAAERLAQRPAWAVDLSGEVKEFSVDPMPLVTLRSMLPGDLPALQAWLAEDHMQRWFAADGEPTRQRVTDYYLPAIEGRDPTRMWVVECNGRSIGFCQDYVIREHPDYAVLAPDPDAVGLDYAIGIPAFVGRGIGVRLLWALLRSARARYPEATTFFAAPDHRNAASLRVLEKVGFRQGTWFDEPQPDGSTTTMVGCSLDVRTVLG